MQTPRAITGVLVLALVALAWVGVGTAPASAAGSDDVIEGAVPLSSGVTTEAFLSPAGEHDYYRFEAQGGRTYSIEASDTHDTGSDPVLYLSDYDYFDLRMRNDDRLIGGDDAEIRWSCSTTGTYFLLVDDPDSDGGGYTIGIQDLGTLEAGEGSRIAGADRFAVAKVVAEQQMGSLNCSNVIIASGLDRSAADPLAAVGLAGTLDAPILLINQDRRDHTLPPDTVAAIQAIRSARTTGRGIKFWIVGGTASVPDWVIPAIASQFTRTSLAFKRLSGADRYACAARVAAEMRTLQGTPALTFIANGESPTYFYDAMAAGPVAYAAKAPVLLVKRSSIPQATLTELSAGGYGARYVVGSTYEVLGRVVTGSGATRIGYSASSYDRTKVARTFAEWASAHGYASRSPIVVANKFADALTGSCLVGSRGGVLLFTSRSGTVGTHLEDFTQLSRGAGTPDFTIVGGEVSVSDGVNDRMLFLSGN